MSRRSRASKAVAASKKQPLSAMTNFARVSKHPVAGKPAIGKDLAEKAAAQKIRETAIEIIITSVYPPPPSTSSGKKRKAAAAVDTEGGPNVPPSPSKRATKRARNLSARQADAREPLPRTPSQRTINTFFEVDPTGAQQAGALLERLNLQSSPSVSSSSFTSGTSITSAGDSGVDLDFDFPQALVDLQTLNSAFLKTLSIHYAHNGTAVPVAVSAICPTIAQAWGKRKVTLDDIRRCIGVLDAKTHGVFDTTAPCPFFLSELGRGGACIELHPQHVGSGHLGEETLKRIFNKNLEACWAKRLSPDVEPFLASLPRATIVPCNTGIKANPLLTKGQRALEELKNSMAAKRQDKENKTSLGPAPPVVNADGSKMSLLDRIRYRQLQQSENAERAPSAAELQRRAALLRAGDVADVVAMLAASGGAQNRVAFTMARVLSRLRDSLRTPISAEEAVACLRLLAAEIAPEWLRVVTVGGRDNVVVMTDLTPSKATLQERVKALIV